MATGTGMAQVKAMGAVLDKLQREFGEYKVETEKKLKILNINNKELKCQVDVLTERLDFTKKHLKIEDVEMEDGAGSTGAGDEDTAAGVGQEETARGDSEEAAAAAEEEVARQKSKAAMENTALKVNPRLSAFHGASP